MTNRIAFRLQKLMAEWGIDEVNLAADLGWTSSKINRILKGEEVLDDPELLRLSVHFNQSPQYLYHGVHDIDSVPVSQRARLGTLYNLWRSVVEREAPEEAEKQLVREVLHGAGSRRVTREVSRVTIDDALHRILTSGRFSHYYEE